MFFQKKSFFTQKILIDLRLHIKPTKNLVIEFQLEWDEDYIICEKHKNIISIKSFILFIA